MPTANSILIITVFLRVLEYYAGILFLTTNRIGDFDEAFASRIHISLYYPQLDLESTKAIFELNLNLIKRRFKSNNRTISIDEKKILAFAEEYFNEHGEEKWNGRQIRNACQTALALAEFRAQGGSHKRLENIDAAVELNVEDLKTVSTAYLQFMQYLNDVRGKDIDRWAKGMKIRARELDLLFNKGGDKSEERERVKENQGRTVAATSAHQGKPQFSAAQVASQASPPVPTGPPPAPQYGYGLNTTYPNYHWGPHYAQGAAAPYFMPPVATQPPPVEHQAGPLPPNAQLPPNMSGWQQAPPQVPPPATEPQVSGTRPPSAQPQPNMNAWYYQQQAAQQ